MGSIFNMKRKKPYTNNLSLTDIPHPRPASALDLSYPWLLDPANAVDFDKGALRSRVMSMPDGITRSSDYPMFDSSKTTRGVSLYDPAPHSSLYRHSVADNTSPHRYFPSPGQEVSGPRTIHIRSAGSESDESSIRSLNLPANNAFPLNQGESQSCPMNLRLRNSLKTLRMKGAPERGEMLGQVDESSIPGRLLSTRAPIRISSAPVTMAATDDVFSFSGQMSYNDSVFSVESYESDSSQIEPGRSMASLLSQYGKLPCENQISPYLSQHEEVTSVYDDDDDDESEQLNITAVNNDDHMHYQALGDRATETCVNLGDEFDLTHHDEHDEFLSVASLYSVACGMSDCGTNFPNSEFPSSDRKRNVSVLHGEYQPYQRPLFPSMPAQYFASFGREFSNSEIGPPSPLEQLSMGSFTNQPSREKLSSDTYDCPGMRLQVSRLITRLSKPISLHKADSATPSVTTFEMLDHQLTPSEFRGYDYSTHYLGSLLSKELYPTGRPQRSNCSSESSERTRLSVCVDFGERYTESRFKINDYTVSGSNMYDGKRPRGKIPANMPARIGIVA